MTRKYLVLLIFTFFYPFNGKIYGQMNYFFFQDTIGQGNMVINHGFCKYRPGYCVFLTKPPFWVDHFDFLFMFQHTGNTSDVSYYFDGNEFDFTHSYSPTISFKDTLDSSIVILGFYTLFRKPFFEDPEYGKCLALELVQNSYQYKKHSDKHKRPSCFIKNPYTMKMVFNPNIGLVRIMVYKQKKLVSHFKLVSINLNKFNPKTKSKYIMNDCNEKEPQTGN